MTYRFLAISDIHWGAMGVEDMYQNLQIFLKFIELNANEIDFIVICGDYFDYRLQLNSKIALASVRWMEEFVSICRKCGVKKIRIIKGTEGHDYDQLEIFRPTFEDEDGYYRIIKYTEREQLFDDLSVVYCPDEAMNLEEYEEKYWNVFTPAADIMFFHGNWDNVLPSIEYNRIQDHHLPTMIYQYQKFSRLIRGPMIGGHWHIGTDKGALHYIGSFDRWKFGEEEPKGFIFGAYNTDTSKYFIHRVQNTLAIKYDTLIVSSDEYNSPSDFSKVVDMVMDRIGKDHDMKLHVSYLLMSDSNEARENYNTFARRFANSRQVKVDLKDIVRKEAKKNRTKQVEEESSKYAYIYDASPKNIPNVIQKFILDKRNVEIPMEIIEKYVSKYLEE